jgi:streptomycin 6-kinase
MSSQACYPEKAPKVDELLDTLSHHLRRELVLYFETHADNESATLDDVVAHIEQRVPAESTETLHIEIHHNHLPKLAERGWLDYDRRSGHIRYRGHDQATRWVEEVCAVF